MPRIYKHDPRSKTYKKHTREEIQAALTDLRLGMSYRDASRKHKIHYSVLYRHSKKPMKNPGGQTVLTNQEEKLIVDQLVACSDWGYPLDHYDLRVIVKNYLDGRGKTVKKFKNNMPGYEFAYHFMKRHKDSLRTRICQNIKRTRASVSPDDIKKYFDHLEKELKDVSASNIFNYDETNVSDDPGRKKVISKRGCRYPERVCNFSKASTSIMFAASAEGKLLPPYVVYKAHNLYESWTVGGIKGARYNRSASGWFDSTSFSDWVENIAIPTLKKLPGKKFLIGDNLSSHFSANTVKSCLEHNISFIFLPPNSTHLTQPLDVAFFRPLKAAWRKILETWKMNEGRKCSSIPKDRFPHFLKELYQTIEENREKNIRSGFRKCGIFPLNREEVLKQLPAYVHTEDQDAAQHVNNAVVDLLKKFRYPDQTSARRRRKKVDVPAGKSIGGADFLSENESVDISSDDGGNFQESMNAEEENGQGESEESDEDMHLTLADLKKRDQQIPENNQHFASHNQKTFDNVFPISLEAIQECNWLVVAFLAEHGKLKKFKYYIGKVLSLNKTDKEFEGSFLRSRATKQFPGYLYSYPNVPDICVFRYDQIVGQVFPVIDEEHPHSSKRECLHFPVNQYCLE